MNESKKIRERLFGWLVARGVVLSLGVSVASYAVLEFCSLLLRAPGKGEAALFSMPFLLVSAAVFIVCVVAVVLMARMRLPSEDVFTAWLDDRNSFGGILQAGGSPGSDAWIGGLGEPKAVRFKVDFRREGLLLALSILFLAAILLFPRTFEEIGGGRKLDIMDEIEAIEDKIQILEQASELPEEKVEELKEVLESIRENDYADGSSKTYEMLDMLDERVNNEISGLHNGLVAEGTSMEMLAQALEALSKLDGQFASTAGAEIGKFISELAEQDPELAKMLSELAKNDSEMSPSELARRTDDKSLSKEQCEKLAELLRKNADRIKERLRQIAEEMKKNPNCNNGVCQNSVPFDEKSLEEWLNSNCPATLSTISSEQAGGAPSGKPGEGQPSRGRGDAPLEFSGNPEKIDGKFNEMGLDGMAKADEATVVGRTLSAPVNAEKDAEAAAGGTLSGGRTEAESKDKPVHPQHRRAVRQYFGE